ncbi:MAG TPA: hypothetical protein VMD30_04370, partial [Tepidisphaeraceae bacterium]|nr:hypothetical protein [Tepidisphaeraceae bacterium]
MTQTASDAVPPIPSRRGVRRRIWRAVKILAVLYVVACTIMFFLQTTIIYPGSWTQGQTETVLPASIRQDVIRLRGRDGVSIVGLFGGAQSEDGQAMEDTSHCPTIIYFYGNGSCLADSTQQFEDFRRLGANVIMADYEGYGMSGGKASETGCYDTADAEYDYLRGRGDIDMSRIVPIGWSLGGA